MPAHSLCYGLDELVSAQAHWGAARTFGIADAEFPGKVARLEFLRDETLLQGDFYLKDAEDQKRLDKIREGDGLDDLVQDARQLSALIRPKRALIKDPTFKTEWLDEAVALADEVEKATSERKADGAAENASQNARQLRDRTVAQLQKHMREIRKYGRHAYRKEPAMLRAFQSEYLRRKRRRRKKK